MSKTLIVTDRLSISYPPSETTVVRWHERPSVEAFPVVVLDLYFGDPGDDGCAHISSANARFYELGAEVARCLKAGGVVIACMGPVAVTPGRLVGPAHRQRTLLLKGARLQSEHIPDYELEASYDWLDQGLLIDLKIGHQFAKRSSGIHWRLPRERFSRAKQAFRDYFEPLSGVDLVGSRRLITYRVEEGARWDTIQGVCQTEPLIVGTAEHTNRPVAISFNYNHFGGRLVLMPFFQVPNPADALEFVQDMKDMGDWIRATIAPETEQPPEWASKYLAPSASAIEHEISALELRKAQLTEELKPYHRMLALLYGTGDELARPVESLFNTLDSNMKVTRTEQGAHLDVFVQDASARTLAIEVTGVKGPLRHNDPHWADFLQYMPEHHARNESQRVERIVLVVNTFRESPPSERDRNSDVSAPVRKTASDNGICVIRSADLYDLWLKTLEGLSLQEVFDTLFGTEGVYDPALPGAP